MWKKATTLYAAYHHREGVTEKFIMNGMRNALQIVGYMPSAEEEKSWVYEVEFNSKDRFVEMYLKYPRGLDLLQHHVTIRPGERFLIDISSNHSGRYPRHGPGVHLLKVWHNDKYGEPIGCGSSRPVLARNRHIVSGIIRVDNQTHRPATSFLLLPWSRQFRHEVEDVS